MKQRMKTVYELCILCWRMNKDGWVIAKPRAGKYREEGRMTDDGPRRDCKKEQNENIEVETK